MEQLRLEIKQLLVEVSNLPGLKAEDIGDQQSLFQDGLGLDSIDVLELVVALDKRYAFKVKNDEKGREVLKNVESLANALSLSRQGASTQ